MNKLILALILTFLPSLAQASVPYSAKCISAGGYYADIRAETLSDGRIHVTAGNGYAFTLADQLGLSRDIFRLDVMFDRSNCRENARTVGGILCAGNALVSWVDRSAGRSRPVRQPAMFNLTSSREGPNVLLNLQSTGSPQDYGSYAHANYVFSEPLSRCVFD